MKKVLYFLSLGLLILTLACNKTNEQPEFYEALEYNILFGDKLAGYQKSWKNDDGSYQYEYEYNDRGRGPHIEERIELNSTGTIIRHEIDGLNYYKDTVSENFEVTGNTAKWKSTSEKGEASFDGISMFSAMNTSFGSTDLFIKKLLNAKSREISLLPSGSLKIASEERHTIDSLSLRLIELTGQSFTPSYVWIDEQDRFFAYTSSWVNCIRKGYDSIAKKLYPIQQTKEQNYFSSLSADLIENYSNIVIENATIFNTNTGNLDANKHIHISENKIVKISDEKIVVQDAKIIDASGKTVLPGLFDMHTHMNETSGLMHLAAGVTSARDLANSFDFPELANKFNTNILIGPRIVVMAGFIDQAGPYAGPTGAIVNSLDEGLKAIEDYHSKGYKQIKLYSSIDPKWVKPMADKAHKLNMRVSGHIPSFMTAEQAVKNGYDEIQHANMIALNFLSDTIDTRTPLRFSMVGKHNHNLDFDSDEFQNFIKLLKEKKIVVDPTVSIFDGMLTSKAGEPDPSFEMILERLPLSIQRGFYSGGLPIEVNEEAIYKASYQKLLGIVKQLYDNGITIVPGTDSMAGFGLHTELENYVLAGIPPKEVLKIATLTSAQVSGVDSKLGSIEVGKLADLIIVDGDPSKDIGKIRNIEITIKDGKVYDPKKLYNAIGVRYFK